MPNIMTVLKAEIVRLARKESKAAVEPFHKSAADTRKALADMKRRVDDLEKQVRQLCATAARTSPSETSPSETSPPEAALPETKPESTRPSKGFSAKSVRALRLKLGLSQRQLAELLGVGHATVYKWEVKPGMLKLNQRTKAALTEARGMGARNAKKRLEALSQNVTDATEAASDAKNEQEQQQPPTP